MQIEASYDVYAVYLYFPIVFKYYKHIANIPLSICRIGISPDVSNYDDLKSYVIWAFAFMIQLCVLSCTFS